jgi:hypothetical protein
LEREAFGVLYERYAMGRLLGEFVRRGSIRTAVELPARGAKAMPSMYSHGLVEAGCRVTLVNPVEKSRPLWEKLGLADRVAFAESERIDRTGFPDASFDLVWNFAILPGAEDPGSLVREMGRISRRYVLVLSVNRGNVGFPCHRLAHRWSGIPWTHGDIRFNRPGFVRQFLRSHGLQIRRWGFVDCPVWPDSLGFRDLRLHRLGVDLDALDWQSDYFEYGTNGGVPTWIRAVHAFERLPMPRLLKTLYAHLFFVLAEKPGPPGKPGES